MDTVTSLKFSAELVCIQTLFKHLDEVDSEELSEYMTSLSDSFTILGLWVLGLAVIHINESNRKHMSPEHFFLRERSGSVVECLTRD